MSVCWVTCKPGRVARLLVVLGLWLCTMAAFAAPTHTDVRVPRAQDAQERLTTENPTENALSRTNPGSRASASA